MWLILEGCSTPPAPAPPPSPDAALIRRAQPLLGTYVVISAYGSDPGQVHAAINAGFDAVRRVDALMSLHRADSELARLNREGFRPEGVEVSPELFHVLATAQDISQKTEGAFDITIRPLADLWGFIWKEYRLPTAGELAEVLPRVDWRQVALEPATRRVRFLRPDISLDLGGIAKGYAVDQALEALQKKGLAHGMVRAGGDLRVMGAPPGRSHWEVQLEDPRRRGQRVVLPLRDAAVSSSGDYENFFMVEGRRYSHLLDPRTGLPVTGVAACTVVAPTCLESDAWATACSVYGAERSLRDFGDRLGLRLTVVRDAAGEGEDVLEVLTSPSFPVVRPRE